MIAWDRFSLSPKSILRLAKKSYSLPMIEVKPRKAGERMRRPSEKISALEASFLLRTEGSSGLDKEFFTFYNK